MSVAKPKMHDCDTVLGGSHMYAIFVDRTALADSQPRRIRFYDIEGNWYIARTGQSKILA